MGLEAFTGASLKYAKFDLCRAGGCLEPNDDDSSSRVFCESLVFRYKYIILGGNNILSLIFVPVYQFLIIKFIIRSVYVDFYERLPLCCKHRKNSNLKHTSNNCFFLFYITDIIYKNRVEHSKSVFFRDFSRIYVIQSLLVIFGHFLRFSNVRNFVQNRSASPILLSN